MGFIEISYSSNPNLSQVNVDSDLNMKYYDIINVKRFLCQDYMGALKTVSSINKLTTLILDDVSGLTISKKIRIPSNIIAGSSIDVNFRVVRTGTIAANIDIYHYDQEDQLIDTIAKSIDPSSDKYYTASITNLKGGDYICFITNGSLSEFKGSSGVNILCDYTPYNDAIWEVID